MEGSGFPTGRPIHLVSTVPFVSLTIAFLRVGPTDFGATQAMTTPSSFCSRTAFIRKSIPHFVQTPGWVANQLKSTSFSIVSCIPSAFLSTESPSLSQRQKTTPTRPIDLSNLKATLSSPEKAEGPHRSFENQESPSGDQRRAP